MAYLFGATVHTPKMARGNAVSTIERRAGPSGEVYLLACVRGDLATPALESIKSTFVRLTTFDAAAAEALAAAAPAVIAEAVAVALLVQGRTYAATTGSGRVYQQRGGTVRGFTGAAALRPGDDIIASSGELAVEGALFTAPAPAASPGSRTDALDAELVRALDQAAPQGVVAVAAARVPA